MKDFIIPDKLILDACCGGRHFWINKKHPDTLYIDIREEERGFLPDRTNFSIKPDMKLDFRDLPFPDKSFKLIIWDPPHQVRKDGQKHITGILIKHYGALNADTWRSDLKRGFDELWRVLDDCGTLIFKFNDRDVNFEDVLKLFHKDPLIGTITKKDRRGETRWFCFFKSPESSMK